MPALTPAMTAALDDYASWQGPLFGELHNHPELSMQEEHTRVTIAEQLNGYGYQAQHIGGVVGVLANGEGPTVLHRADIDGLLVKETSGLPYASTHTQTDAEGETTPTMHACGHDVHTVAGKVAVAPCDAHSGRLHRIIELLTDLARAVTIEGVTPNLHPHVGTWVESAEETRYILDRIDPDLMGFGPDVGHLAWADAEGRASACRCRRPALTWLPAT